MKKIIFLIAILVISLQVKVLSQEDKFSVDLSVPVSIGDNFINVNYQSYVDLGFKYNFFQQEKLKIGASANIGLLEGPYVGLWIIKPRIYAEFFNYQIRPYAGLGYSILYYAAEQTLPHQLTYESELGDGLNLNFGMKLFIGSRFYLNLGYDFIKQRKVGEMKLSSSYNSNLQFINLGLGFTF